MRSWFGMRQRLSRQFSGLSRAGRALLNWWLVVSLLSAPGAGAISMLKDLATTPPARALVMRGGQSLQVVAGQLPRLGITAGAAALIAGLFGLPESDPSSVQAQSANDIVYIYDALGRIRSVIDPAGDAAVYQYDAVGNLLSIGRQAATVTNVVEVAPSSAAPGASVAIEGAGFSATPSANTVTFNGVSATVTSASLTKLVVTVPPSATTGTVAVTAPGGSASSPSAFTVVTSSAAPTITSFSPTNADAGTSVTITGTNFSTIAATNRVTLNGMQALVETATATATSLSVKVPPGISHGRFEVSTSEGSAQSANDFLVAASLSNLDFGGRIPAGSTGTVNVSTGTNFGILLFDGTAGQKVSIVLSGGTFTGLGNAVQVSAYDPHGARIYGPISVQSGGFMEPFTLLQSGTYMLWLDPIKTWGGQMTAQVYPITDIEGTIPTNGTATGVTLTVPGQTANLTFSATAGQKFSAVMSGGGFTGLGRNIAVSVLNDQGATMAGPALVQSAGILGPFVLPAAGTYTLHFNPNTWHTGGITAQLHTVVDVTGSIPADGTPTTATLTTPGQVAQLSFTGTANQKVSLALSGGGFTGLGNGIVVSLVDPTGTSLGWVTTQTSGYLDTRTLPSNGTYSVVFDPHSYFTGSMTARLYTVVDVTGSITPNGSAVAVTTTVPGQTGRLSFTGAANQEVTVNLTGGNFTGAGNGVVVAIQDASGTDVGGAITVQTTGTLGPRTLPSAGTYDIVFNPNAAFTGSVTAALTTPGAVLPPNETSIDVVAVRGPPDLGQADASSAGAASILQKLDADTTTSRVAQAPPRAPTPTPTIPDEDETWTPTEANRRGNWQSERPQPTPFIPLGHDPKPLTSDGIDLTVEGEPITTISLTSPKGQTRQNARGQTVWEGQLLGPQGEVRGRVELTADGRGRADQTTLVGNAYGADDELLATVRVTLEAEDQGRLAVGRGVEDTAVSVTYQGQQLRTVTLLVDGTGKPKPQTGPPARTTPDPRPSPELRPSPQPPAASPPARQPGPGRDASPIASPGASPSATATPGATPTPTVTTPPVSGAPAEGAPSLQLDGRQLRLASIALTDAKPQLLPTTTALSGQVLALSGKPLAEVTLSIGGVSTQTDRTGRFLLAPLPDGHQVLTIDGRTTNRPGRQFGVFQAGVELKPGVVNVLPYTIWMPALDTKAAVQIPPVTTRETVLTTPHIPGLEIHIPAGAQVRDIDGKPATEVGITAIPVDQTPFPIPQFVEVPVYFTVQPGAATIDAPSGAWVVYPNYSDLPPGARADFWQYDPKKRGWFVYGQGTVTADGKQVVPDPNVRIYDFTGFMFNGHGWAPPSIGAAIDNWTKDGDPVDLETGLFILEKTDLALPDTVPLNLTRTYRPNDAQNRPFGIGATHPYEIFLWTTMNGMWQDYSQVWLVLPDGARVYYPRISPGTGWTDAVFENIDAPTAYYKSRITFRSGGWDLTLLDGTVYRFGDNAPLQWIRDRYGNITRILRTGVNGQGNGTGPVTRVISPNGRWIAFNYGSGNRVSEVTDSLGRTVSYTYDGTGRLTKVTDPAGGETEYTYDASHRMLTIEDARNIVFLTNTYDANGRVATQTQADSTTYQFAYTVGGGGFVTQTDVTNPRGHVRRVQFNSTRRVTSETFALGTGVAQTVSYTRRSGDNFILSVTDPLGRQTTFDYDSSGNVTSVIELAGTGNARTTTATYESKYQQIKTVTDPLNRTTTFTYDARGNLTAVTDPLNHTTSATYDGTGRLLTIKNALNHVTQLGYSGPDLVSVTDPLNRTARLWMDGAGRVLLAIDPLGNRLRLEYDALNQIKKVIDPFGGQTQFTYDANGNLLTVTDARNGVTQYAYNNMDRLTTVTDPLTRGASASYDANGNVTSTTDRKSQTTTVTYDALDRPTLVTFADSSTVTPTYDGIGRVTQLADSANGTLTYAYDSFDRLTSETSPQGVVSYGYDNVDRQTSMTVTGQTAVTYAYDDADRLTTITQGATSASLTYDAADRRSTMTLPNGVVVEHAYDNASNLTGLTYKQGGTTLGNLAYTLDVLGRRERVGGTYARTGVPQALTSATYDAANQLTAWGGTSFTYDATGNLTNDGASSYTWNARGELTSMSGGTSAAFQYDALGRRRSKTFGGTTTGFLYDGASIVQELTGGSPSANLLHGPGVDELLTRTDSAGARHLLGDGLGSTLGLLDPAGTPTTAYTYEPFGRTTSTGSASLNSARFTGREDDGTGLYYYRARYYHPQLQRFISEDPIGFAGGDANLHAYVGNDPVNATDPSGNINPLVAACAGGAATDALTYVALSGRKSTLSGAADAAATGCISGLVGLGIGRLAFAVLPRVTVATRRACSVGRNSFSGDTEVVTESGPRRIDSIRVGDRVLAYDEETGETTSQLVTATWAHEDPVIVYVTVSGELIETTPEHPFSVVGRGWVKASDLRPGDRIHRAFGGAGPVTNVIVARQSQVMYNLTVDAAHTFFVGDDEWLVHNECGGERPQGIVTHRKGKNIAYLSRAIQELGERWGCHMCGAKSPGPSGTWRMDHDPARRLEGPPYTIRPHCEHCSSSHGGKVKAIRDAERQGKPQEVIDEMKRRLPRGNWPHLE